MHMNKDQAKGRIREAGGKLQKNLGKAMDSPAHEGKGAAREQAGKVQKNFGDMKDEVKQTADDMTPRRGRSDRGHT
jgi:uncharacterized protein YjbJ (UPF0337 family)